MIMNDKQFEIKVRTKLWENDMTGKQLAEVLGITQAYLSDIINGKRQAQHVRDRIINVLNIKEETK